MLFGETFEDNTREFELEEAMKFIDRCHNADSVLSNSIAYFFDSNSMPEKHKREIARSIPGYEKTVNSLEEEFNAKYNHEELPTAKSRINSLQKRLKEVKESAKPYLE